MSYIFYLPNYVPSSNGIKSLWYAALLFSRQRDTKIVTFLEEERAWFERPAVYNSLISSFAPLAEDDIVIYPDTVEGNPLGAKRVARYLMAKPYILTGRGIEKNKGDFLFAFSRAVDKNLPQLTVLLPELAELARYKKEKKENTVIIYYGKCRVSLCETQIKEIIRDFGTVKIVTRTVPESKDVLYGEIANASLLVSFDPLSSLAYEANLVGTPTLLLDPVFREDFNNFNHKLFGFFYDYAALKDKDLLAVGQDVFERSHSDLREILSRGESDVLRIISQMEGWFDAGRDAGEETEVDAIEFYNEKWKASPFINCTNMASVIAYNIMRKNLLFYVAASLSYKSLRALLGAGWGLKRCIVHACLTPFEIDVIKYKLRPDARRVQYQKSEGAVVADIPKESIIQLDNGFQSRILRWVCM